MSSFLFINPYIIYNIMLLWSQKIRDVLLDVESGRYQLILLIFGMIKNLYLFYWNFFLIRTLLVHYSTLPFLFILGLNELLLCADLMALNKILKVSASMRYGDFPSEKRVLSRIKTDPEHRLVYAKIISTIQIRKKMLTLFNSLPKSVQTRILWEWSFEEVLTELFIEFEISPSFLSWCKQVMQVTKRTLEVKYMRREIFLQDISPIFHTPNEKIRTLLYLIPAKLRYIDFKSYKIEIHIADVLHFARTHAKWEESTTPFELGHVNFWKKYCEYRGLSRAMMHVMDKEFTLCEGVGVNDEFVRKVQFREISRLNRFTTEEELEAIIDVVLTSLIHDSNMKVFVINNYLKLVLNFGLTKIFVNNRYFDHCKYLLLHIPIENSEKYEDMSSIDEASEILNKDLELSSPYKYHITPQEEFWGHCSNIQAWVENKYDTRILHSNLAFPLLKRLVAAGDPLAKRVFKEEIVKRLIHGYFPVVLYLLEEDYLQFFSQEEIRMILVELVEKDKFDILALIEEMSNIKCKNYL